MVMAPREVVWEVYADYANWPGLFPTIRAVRVIRQEDRRLVLEIDHAEGMVINELVLRPPEDIDIWEIKRHYDARFHNRFESVAAGTRFTVIGDISLKGYARLLRPFLTGHVRRLMMRLQLQPVKEAAEARARQAAVGDRSLHPSSDVAGRATPHPTVES